MKLYNSIINKSHKGLEGQGPVILFGIININNIYQLIITHIIDYHNYHTLHLILFKVKKKKWWPVIVSKNVFHVT